MLLRVRKNICYSKELAYKDLILTVAKGHLHGWHLWQDRYNRRRVNGWKVPLTIFFRK